MNGLSRRIERGHNRSDDIPNVHDGAPGRAVALYVDPARGVCRSHEIIQHDIESQPRRNAVGGRIPHIGRAEIVVRQRCDVPFNQDLRLPVRGHRIERGCFVQKSSPAAPYVLHEEEKIKRFTPACFRQLASCTDAR